MYGKFLYVCTSSEHRLTCHIHIHMNYQALSLFKKLEQFKFPTLLLFKLLHLCNQTQCDAACSLDNNNVHIMYSQ